MEDRQDALQGVLQENLAAVISLRIVDIFVHHIPSWTFFRFDRICKIAKLSSISEKASYAGYFLQQFPAAE